MKTSNKTIAFLMLLALAVFVAGFRDDDDENPVTHDMGSDARLGVVHAFLGAPTDDVFVGGTDTELVGNLSFSNLSPAVQVPPASFDLELSFGPKANAIAAGAASSALSSPSACFWLA